MDIEYDMQVMDKDGKALGTVDRIIMDTWSGEPRKYMIRLNDDEAIFFTPKQVASVANNGVTLNIADEELERT
ncbi:MAG: DUF2171 domain-containing protein [Dehalococcoidales bacterium]|nr:DUF2171 domain-containing protein [Dehalococcoidales bacterium]